MASRFKPFCLVQIPLVVALTLGACKSKSSTGSAPPNTPSEITPHPAPCPSFESQTFADVTQDTETLLVYVSCAPEDLTKNEVARVYLDSLPPKQLSILRNAPYARQGYAFQKAWLRAHFEQRKWYAPSVSDITKIQLSPSAASNVSFLKHMESQKLATFQSFLRRFSGMRLPIKVETHSTCEEDPKCSLLKEDQAFLDMVDGPMGLRHFYGYSLTNSTDLRLVTIPWYCGAGGDCAGVWLVVFDEFGNFLDKMEVAESNGDLTEFTTASSYITTALTFTKTTKEEKEDDTGERSTSEKTDRFSILSSGKIVRASE